MGRRAPRGCSHDSRHQQASPLAAASADQLARTVRPLVDRGAVPVLGGFVGATAEGVTTTLGRGGSDYSASLIGACLGASEIQIWTDVDGILTADPRLFRRARAVDHLSFDEASALAHCGAKVLHPATVQPAVLAGIPVRILNAHHPGGRGTVVNAGPVRRSAPAAGIACLENLCVFEVPLPGGADRPAAIAEVYAACERAGAAIHLTAVSDAGVSVAVDDGPAGDRVAAQLDSVRGVARQRGLALVAVVGDGLAAGRAGEWRVWAAFDGIPVRLLSRTTGAMHRIVRGRRGRPRAGRRDASRAAVRAPTLAREPELGLPPRLRRATDTRGRPAGGSRMTAEERPLSVAIAGFGTVGRSVAKILCEGHLRALRLVAVCTRRPAESRRAAPWVPPDVFWTSDIHDVLARPADVIVELIGGVEPARVWIAAALESGRAVVTANKQVMAEHGPALIALARSTGNPLRYEAAVAGAVPVILGLQNGLAGDRVTRIEGVVNGTCNFVLSRMTDGGVSQDEAVREAQARGFAEANPAADLDGLDARAKLSILAAIGLGGHLPPRGIRAGSIRGIDAGDIEAAASIGRVIRQVVWAERPDLEPGAITAGVGVALVRRDSWLGRARGPENVVLVHGERSGTTVFAGQGAGGDATAVAVVSDLLSLARERSVPRAWPATTSAGTSAEPERPHYVRVSPSRTTAPHDARRLLAGAGFELDRVLARRTMARRGGRPSCARAAVPISTARWRRSCPPAARPGRSSACRFSTRKRKTCPADGPRRRRPMEKTDVHESSFASSRHRRPARRPDSGSRDRRAGGADLPDLVVRLRLGRSRGGAVRAAAARTHLHAHRQPHHGGARGPAGAA